jgi:hypothetical protein
MLLGDGVKSRGMPRSLKLLALACSTIALVGCGPTPGSPGLRGFEQYDMRAEITDQPDLNTNQPQRKLLFLFHGHDVKSPDRCASFEGATAEFAGMPVDLSSPGGWARNRIPTNTAPGETINGDSCSEPFIDLRFDKPAGEPQDGTLQIDGDGTLAIVVNRPFGNPRLDLVSVAPDRLQVRLAGFLVGPSLENVSVRFLPNVAEGVGLQKASLTAEGLLTLLPPAGSLRLGGTLMINVDLGDAPTECRGFLSCRTSSHVFRSFDIDGPRP